MKFTKSSLPVWKKNEPLSKYSYIKLGGPADFFTVAKSADELAGAVEAAEKAGVPWFILGGGSNILVGDLGFRGLVIKNEADKIATSRPGVGTRNDAVILTAESGALMSKLAAFAIGKGLAGLEMFMSVPGTVGGAIYNNSHYRPERNEFIGNLVESAEVLYGKKGSDLDSGERSDPFSWKRVTVNRNWFRFGYDYSRLQDESGVVLKVKFCLQKASPAILRERSLVLMKDRNSHQPIGKPSCGCMFKNPNRIEGFDPSRMSARLPARQAGKLIDEAGMKGTKVGGVSVSATHANFMVNDGTAKVADVLELMSRVKKRVKEKFGVELMPEIFMVGEFSHKPEKFNC